MHPIQLPNVTIGPSERVRPYYCQNVSCRCPLEWPERGIEVKIELEKTREIVVSFFTLCGDCFDLFDGTNARIIRHDPITASNWDKRGARGDR